MLLSDQHFYFLFSAAGKYPKNSPVKFRGDSGLQDGNVGGSTHADLVGGFYDSGNNMKFSFPTAYTITLLSWTVIEYHEKYAEISELEHVKDIIKWGTDYLLKVFIPPSNASSNTVLYSQARPKQNNNNKSHRLIVSPFPEHMIFFVWKK